MPFAWSPAALDDLYRLYVRERRSAAETARLLGGGLTRNAVLGKVQRMGWAKPAAPKAHRPAAPPKPRLVERRAPRRVRSGGPFAREIPLPKLREIAVISSPRLWTEREARQCAFPVGEPEEPGRQYSCCAPVTGRRAYCGAHWALMTLSGTALTRKDEDAIVEIARRAA